MYVAVSRVWKLDDLFLLNFDSSAFRTNTKLARFFQEFLDWIDNHDELHQNATCTVPFPTGQPSKTINKPNLNFGHFDSDHLSEFTDHPDRQHDNHGHANLVKPITIQTLAPITKTGPQHYSRPPQRMTHTLHSSPASCRQTPNRMTMTHAIPFIPSWHTMSSNYEPHQRPIHEAMAWTRCICISCHYRIWQDQWHAALAWNPIHNHSKYQIDTIIGDVNWFFGAISKEIFGTEPHHAMLRVTITTYIQQNLILRHNVLQYSSVHDDDALFDNICEMQVDGCWEST